MKTIITLIEKMINNETLTITEGTYMETDKTMDLNGNINGTEVSIHLWFSMAPSLQSLLSRGGIVDVNISLKIDGVHTEYHSHILPTFKTQIGSLICKYNNIQSEKIERQAKSKLAKILTE